MGLVSEGGVHSSMEHLFAFLDIAKEYGLTEVFVHCLMDSRDTDPFSGKVTWKNWKPMARSRRIAIGRCYHGQGQKMGRVKIGYDLAVHGIRRLSGMRQTA